MHNSDNCCSALPVKDCTLPSGAKNLPGSTPNEKAIDRAIEDRYGSAGDAFASMKNPSASSDRFSGPGMS